MQKSLFFVILVSLFVASCKKQTLEPYSFTKTYDDHNFVLDSNSITGTFLLKEYIVETDIIQTLGDKGFTVYNLKSVVLDRARIQVADASRNLNYFTSIELRISNQGAGNIFIASAGLPEENTETVLDLTGNNTELRDVFTQPELIIGVYGTTDLPIQPGPLSMRVSLSFKLEARPGN
jgi:hypothetical protein